MSSKLRRAAKLNALFFKSIFSDGPKKTFKRTAGYLKRRTGKKAGRFLPPASRLAQQEKYEPRFANKIISVITPLYNTDKLFLTEFINSFLAQSYKYGQLVLADASDINHSYVEEYIRSIDSDKIKYIKLDKNGGISLNTNEAVKFADGDYIALADHDDILSPDALYQMASAIEKTGADLIYSDEALFTDDFKMPTAVHFKPDFSYYYLTNCNYICHFACMKKSLFLSLGGLDSRRDGAQDHDLFLKISEKSESIYHIPKILYYWRVHKKSTSGGLGAKPYVTKNAIGAIDRHLERMNIRGRARSGIFPSTYKIDYTLTSRPKVSVIIPNKDHVKLLDKCIKSIYEKTLYENFEIIIVENNSTDKSTFSYYEQIKKRHKNLKVINYKGEFNFSKINNFAVENADGEMYLFLNNDIEIITEGWLCEMAGLAMQKNVGVVGAMLYYPNDTVQHAGVITGLGGYAGHSHKYFPRGSSGYMFRLSCVQDFSAVTGACMLINKSVFKAVSGFDENFAVAFNDVDLCLKVRNLGCHILWTPYAECYHHESISRGSDKRGKKKKRFEKEQALLKSKYGENLLHDPFYNPNLTLDTEDFNESGVLPKYREQL
jgi:GT2 family glycosyltransferase